jgi:hypothetical protein
VNFETTLSKSQGGAEILGGGQFVQISSRPGSGFGTTVICRKQTIDQLSHRQETVKFQDAIFGTPSCGI